MKNQDVTKGLNQQMMLLVLLQAILQAVWLYVASTYVS